MKCPNLPFFESYEQSVVFAWTQACSALTPNPGRLLKAGHFTRYAPACYTEDCAGQARGRVTLVSDPLRMYPARFAPFHYVNVLTRRVRGELAVHQPTCGLVRLRGAEVHVRLNPSSGSLCSFYARDFRRMIGTEAPFSSASRNAYPLKLFI